MIDNVFGIIYKAEHASTGRVYIGQTTRSLHERKANHIYGSKRSKTYFSRALVKYGSENFIWCVLDTAESKEELNCKEIKYIREYRSTDSSYGFNLTNGGDGMSGGNMHKGKTFEEIYGEEKALELKSHLSKVNKGKIMPLEVRKKISDSLIETFNNDEYKKAISERAKKMWENESYYLNQQKMASERWNDVDYRLRTTETLKIVCNTDENRIKRSQTSKKNWENEDYRNKMKKVYLDLRSNGEYHKKLHDVKLGGKNPKAKKVMVNNVVYSCIKDAAIALGINEHTLYSRFHKYRKTGVFPEGTKILEDVI